MTEYREYENGVADVLGALAGPAATVTRNVFLPGRNSKTRRQVDVLARGRLFSVTETTFIADCKRWKSHIDVTDVDKFIGLVRDVGADFGALVTSSGYSPAAEEAARSERGIRIATLTENELRSWRPPGTFQQEVMIPVDKERQFTDKLRNKGYRVGRTASPDPRVKPGFVSIEITRHYGYVNLPIEPQRSAMTEVESTAQILSIDMTRLSHGTVFQGGTPQHRFLRVCYHAEPLFNLLAASEEELDTELDYWSDRLGIQKSALTVDRPSGWPFPPFSL